MLQLKNTTPFAAKLALFPNQSGTDTLYIIVKATFNIGNNWTLADEQNPPQDEDVYWSDDPQNSSIKNASDIHIGKPSTDIIMTGNAQAPAGKNVSQMDIHLSVGHVEKTIRVFGDRQWINGEITRAKPFSSMPLIYEKAFGGIHQQDGDFITAETRNPVGCGFIGKRKAKELNGLPLPNLEDPLQLLQKPGDIVTPAGYSFISPNWQPRLSFAGTYDDKWQKTRAPYLPDDFNIKFFNMAHNDLIYPGYLQGGEPVYITNMHQGGNLQFNLPRVNVVSQVSIQNKKEKPVLKLETLHLEPNCLQLSMVWKAEMLCDKKALKIKQVDIALLR